MEKLQSIRRSTNAVHLIITVMVQILAKLMLVPVILGDERRRCSMRIAPGKLHTVEFDLPLLQCPFL